uniref:Uncharacterized protein LOC105053628 n=1 Tax=Elaeis guineensis var. tenera TaxID=51953 RepID=A0A6I9RVB6_ELAGV|nr:uncharacterized protein LOC105053628 [Elaeis guineensis]
MDDLRHHHHQSIPPPPLADANSAAAPWAFLWEPPQEASGITAEELKQALLRTTVELESTRIAAQEELRRMEAQALNLTHLLEIATRERDEARHQCHALLLLLMDHNNHLASNPNPNPNPSQAVQLDEGSNVAAGAGGLSSSSEGGGEEERSNGTSPAGMAAVEAEMEAAARRRGLPEKGRLLEAVMAAGPLLQTLLLAGPLPQWRHPPPALQTFEIPPVSIGLLNSNNATTGDVTTVAFGGGRSPPPSPPSLPNSTSSSPETESNSSGGYKFPRIRSFHL